MASIWAANALQRPQSEPRPSRLIILVISVPGPPVEMAETGMVELTTPACCCAQLGWLNTTIEKKQIVNSARFRQAGNDMNSDCFFILTNQQSLTYQTIEFPSRELSDPRELDASSQNLKWTVAFERRYTKIQPAESEPSTGIRSDNNAPSYVADFGRLRANCQGLRVVLKPLPPRSRLF